MGLLDFLGAMATPANQVAGATQAWGDWNAAANNKGK